MSFGCLEKQNIPKEPQKPPGERRRSAATRRGRMRPGGEAPAGLGALGMQVPGGNPGPTASPAGAVPLRGAKVQEKEPLKRGGTLQGAPPPPPPAAVRTQPLFSGAGAHGVGDTSQHPLGKAR